MKNEYATETSLENVEEMRPVARYMKELRRYPPLTREEEEKTFALARNGDQKAIDLLLTANLRFVVSVALEYKGRGLPLADLIAIGNTGLMEGLKRFDETRGFKFISYAVWWIRQAILDALKRVSMVSLPANRQEDMSRMARHREQMTQELGRVPTWEEMAQEASISSRRAERAWRSLAPDLSLEALLSGESEEGFSLSSLLQSQEAEPDEKVMTREQAELVARSLDEALNEREASVIRDYFGFNGHDGRTLEEIAGTLHITRERVRQIKERALLKLRRYFYRRAEAGVEDFC